MSSDQVMTTVLGHPIDNNTESLTAGENGPLLIMDSHLIEKLAKFDRERIPERVVHAKGSGAYGIFEVTHDITKYTKADLFNKIGKITPCFARFSTVAGEQGAPDTERDPRGFAVKFYTEEGNWDMVGNNTPVFFIRDPIKFPDLIHSFKKCPSTGLRTDKYWDFLSLTPESAHQLTILFSNRGTPFSFRHMHGFGSHTFRWINAKNEAFYVKYHWMTEQGIKNFTEKEADAMKAVNYDYARSDLRTAIDEKNFPVWRFSVQVMPEAEAEKYRFNVFDVTKVWPHKDYPLIPVGKMTLNRNPKNFFAEVEQSAFAPTNMPPGIEASFDKMLQGRLFSYPDTHRHRLGGNFEQIPVNCPYRARVVSNERDGNMRVNDNYGSKVNFEPNTPEPYGFSERAKLSFLPVKGHVMRFKPSHPNCDFEQPGVLYKKVMTNYERDHLVLNLVNDLKKTKRTYQERQVKIFYKCDPEYGNRVANGLGLSAMSAKL